MRLCEPLTGDCMQAGFFQPSLNSESESDISFSNPARGGWADTRDPGGRC